MRILGDENWKGCESHTEEEGAPRAVRWATRSLQRLLSLAWSKWHYTEGNGLHTACGHPVVLFGADGSPQEAPIDKINCKHCLKVVKRAKAQKESK